MKRSRAQHKASIRKSRKESWIQFVEGLHRGVPATAIYKTIRKIKRKQLFRIHLLKGNNQAYASIPAIAEKLTQSLSDVASNNNYSRDFILYKSTIGQHTCDYQIVILVNHTTNPSTNKRGNTVWLSPTTQLQGMTAYIIKC